MSKPFPHTASLYIGDLSPDVTEGMLFELFNQVGPVTSIRVCRDAITRRSLGYAYVNFHSVLDAERAIDTLNNTPVKNRPCRIMWSQRDPSVRKSGVGNIFIKNLDPEIGHKELYDTFSAFGNILSCKVALGENNQSKGYGFVHFETEEAAQRAISKVNGMIMISKKVFVGRFIPKKERLKSKETSWTNVYIKNLDKEVSSAELETMFRQWGDIASAQVMIDESHQSRGFGFVNFVKHEDAVRAVQEILNGAFTNKEGLMLYAGRAQKKAERSAELTKKFEQLKMERMTKYQGINLYIKNIEDEITEERLRKEFSPFGLIRSVKIMTDDKGNNKGFGFVCFNTPEEAQRAISEMNGCTLSGCQKPLYVNMHEPKEIRRQKLAAQISARTKAMRQAIPQGNPPIYPGTPVFYPTPPGITGNFPQSFVYHQQMLPRQRWNAAPPQHQYPVQGPIPPNYVVPLQTRPPPRGNRTGGTVPNQPNVNRSRPNQNPAPTNNNPRRETKPAEDGAVQNFVSDDQPLNPSQLASLRPEQQKLWVGEKLYPLVHQKEPNLAGKITGMLLDGGFMDDLLLLLENEEALNSRIEEALKILEGVRKNPDGGEVKSGDEAQQEGGEEKEGDGSE